ncbi:carbonic anhydrase 6-like [Belonocnema kinseyi]|uniref:carbonic anhydrase 6-like n=1 Tax=Belonocnema kinseyi TaxID=2817044 RepID=UPI00143DB96A|nr:carbonic anhydrase 6-like [Belonocnema kinseyi]
MYQLHLVATVLFIITLRANAFSYKNAKNWGKKYSKCNGKNQSPIFIKSPSVMGFPDWKKTPLKLTNFEKSPKKLTIKNTGHTVEMTAEWTGDAPSCSGGPLRGKYVFGKATFLWDPKGWSHSEELVPMERQDMEMHMFFYRTDLKSFDKAESKKGGLAVFSLEFSSRYDNPENFLDKFEGSLHKVRSLKSTANVPPFPLANYIKNMSSMVPFTFYEGSLDYPPCSESVAWFLVGNRGAIPKSLIFNHLSLPKDRRGAPGATAGGHSVENDSDGELRDAAIKMEVEQQLPIDVFALEDVDIEYLIILKA